ncbi:2-keto-3-deoxy-D-arabino-heptulosonate-7- phosphate synthase I alpha [Providencia phage PSTCR6]|nr:2-keto-3-deoxy-D-arabino-heptulosonate-7- phosphate synthase I alpha [Providencia phage PSTCR6]
MKVSPIRTPADLIYSYEINVGLQSQVNTHRKIIKEIVAGTNSTYKKMIVVGPCSIHNPQEAIEYGKQLAELQKEIGDKFLLVMRVYFEKPRTTVGWKGLVNDPRMDGSFEIEEGIKQARELCIELLKLGLPLATEVLDPFTIKYLTGIFSWVAIGARTTESQTHREIASGLPMAVGFKNGTSGDIQVAFDAMESARYPHSYLGISMDGKISRITADGNKNTHIILRGGKNCNGYIPMYSKKFCEALGVRAMVDCSHANAMGDFKNQIEVAKSAIQAENVFALMIESNIFEGNQRLIDPKDLKPGVSITDACLGMQDTINLIKDL